MIDLLKRMLDYMSMRQCRCNTDFLPDFWTYILTGKNVW
jgi:hypothetical protein